MIKKGGVMKHIKKVAGTLLKISGYIFNTTSITDKTTNTYSAEVIEKLLEGTVIYDTGVDTVGVLRESVTKFKRLRIYAMSSDYHYIVQEILIKPHYTDETGIVTSFWAGSVSTDGYFYGKNARLNIKGKTFNIDRNHAVTVKTGTGMTSSSDSNAFSVQKIVGYNYF